MTVAATRLPGQPHRLAVEERHVEARVVRDEHGVAREREEAPDGGRDRRRAPQLVVAQPGERRDRRLQPRARVRERLEPLARARAPDAHGADLARPRRPRPQAGRLQVEDDERRALEQQLVARGAASATRSPAPAQPRVRRDGLVEQRPRQPDRDGRSELQHCARRLVGRHRPAPFLDQLDQPVGGVQAELQPCRR